MKKICIDCGEGKEPREFYKKKEYRDGHMGHCKKCDLIRRRRYWDKNRKINKAGLGEIPPSKVCPCCAIEKDIDEFDISNISRDRHHRHCKSCRAKVSKRRYALNTKSEREKRLKKLYGLTIDQYDKMLEKQGWVCAISGDAESDIDRRTGKIKALAVDHSHKTGGIRELLCSKWNKIIGLSGESPELLRKAADYLEKWNGK